MIASIYALVDSRAPSEYRYIGKTVKTLAHRLYHHKYKANRDANLHKVRWMNKVEIEGGEVLSVLLEECSPEDQDVREIYWIRKAKQDGHRLTNMSDGGEGGINPCAEVLARIVAKNKGKKRSPEVRAAISERAKLRVGEKNPNYGRTHSAEARAKMSSHKKGKPLTAAHRAKLAETGKAKLTAAQATEIYRLAAVERLPYKEIASMFPITTKAVSHIATGNRWKHLNLSERFK